MHLNQLYGYFGRSQELIITQNVNSEELEEILQTKIVETVITIKTGSYVVLMKGNLNHQLIHQLNYTLDLTDYKKLKRNVKTNVAIAAAVTAYAQIEMIKYKTLPGYEVYYSDTDSIFLNKPLPNKMVGKELGLMKNELIQLNTNSIDKTYFLGNKKYGYRFTNKDNQIIDKSIFSGAKRDSLTFEEIEKISKGYTITKTYPNIFMRNFQKMQIAIKDRKISLSISTNKKLINNNYISPRIITDYNQINLNNDSIVNKTLKIIKLLFKRLLN